MCEDAGVHQTYLFSPCSINQMSQLLLYPEHGPLQVASVANVVLFCFVLGTK